MIYIFDWVRIILLLSAFRMLKLGNVSLFGHSIFIRKGKIIVFCLQINEITEKEQFLHYIESNRDRWVLIHIYDEDNEGCITLNKVFDTLAVRYPNLRLAKVLPQTIGMSPQFVCLP